MSRSSAAIVPAQYDVGNHCDSCRTRLSLPFNYYLYGRPYSVLDVAPDGFLEFVSGIGPSNPDQNGVNNTCLPAAGLANVIMPYWTDMRTDISGTVPSGIFTSVTGTAPNRTYNVEWRANHIAQDQRKHLRRSRPPRQLPARQARQVLADRIQFDDVCARTQQ